MTITEVQVFSLSVSDHDRSRDVSVDARGVELISDVQMGPGMRWGQVAPPGRTTSVSLVTWFPTMLARSAYGTVLETDDVEGDIADLEGRGVQIDGEFQDVPGGRFVSFDDPDGHGIVLETTAQRDWLNGSSRGASAESRC